MQDQPNCSNCRSGEPPPFAFSHAFQPIVDIHTREVFAHEALVRGAAGESARSVLERVTEDNRYHFDQASRVKAIELAARVGIPARLSINFMPNAIYRPELCIRSALAAAHAHGFAPERIIFEAVEGERVQDGKWLATILREYQRIGFLTAIDDFGAGFAGLTLLADFQPDLIKLDMALVRDVHRSRPRQAIVRGVAAVCAELGVSVIAEGIESADEMRCLEDMGIRLMQGYLFAHPRFEGCDDSSTLHVPRAGG